SIQVVRETRAAPAASSAEAIAVVSDDPSVSMPDPSARTAAVAPRAMVAAVLIVRWRRAGTVLMVDLLSRRLHRIRRPPRTGWVRAGDVLRDGRIAAQGDPDPTLRSGVTGVNGVLPGVMLEASPPASDPSNR